MSWIPTHRTLAGTPIRVLHSTGLTGAVKHAVTQDGERFDIHADSLLPLETMVSQERFTPTHLTQDGMPVEIQGEPADQGHGVPVHTRSGERLIFLHETLIPVGSPEAEDLLAELGLRTEAAGQEDDSNRVTLARWTQAVEAARASLQDGAAEVLAMSGTDGPGWAARRRLEKALVDAGERLATFRP